MFSGVLDAHHPVPKEQPSAVPRSATSNVRPPANLDPVLRPYDLPRAAVPGFAPVFRRVDLFQAIELAD
jgi:hypothetical protein